MGSYRVGHDWSDLAAAAAAAAVSSEFNYKLTSTSVFYIFMFSYVGNYYALLRAWRILFIISCERGQIWLILLAFVWQNLCFPSFLRII